METILFLAVASIVVLLLMVLRLNSALDKQIKLNDTLVLTNQIQDQFNAKICRLMHLIATRVDEHTIKLKELG